MPELPEVETIKRDLEKKVLRKKISAITIPDKKVVGTNYSAFSKILKGNSITSIERFGKLLVFNLADKKNHLLIHLKMTGQLIYVHNKDIVAGGHAWGEEKKSFWDYIGGKLPNKFTRAYFTFTDHGQLFFNDMRRFGYVKVVDEKSLAKIKADYGLEPFTKEFNWNNFKKIFAGRKANVKSLLLDQKLIAGIGNIYSDEILFAAGLNPKTTADKLSDQKLKKIFSVIEKIFKEAIKHRGTTFSDYRDASGKSGNFLSHLKVYGRVGQQCKKCKTPIKKIKIGSRSSSFCPKCQK